MHSAECRTALERLSAFLAQPAAYDAEVAAAIDHIGTCPHCRHNQGYLVRALNAKEEDQLSCQECQEQLPEYLDAAASGQVAAAHWRVLALHLATCPHCSAAYAEVADLLAFAQRERGVEPPSYPTPQLSFLRPQPDKTSWKDKLGRLVIEFSTELVRALQAPPSLQPAYATRKAGERAAPLLKYTVTEEGGAEVTITAEAERGKPDRCTLSVQVDLPGREALQLAGTAVTLRRDQQPPQTQETNSFGEVVFEGVAIEELPRLVFEVGPLTGER